MIRDIYHRLPGSFQDLTKQLYETRQLADFLKIKYRCDGQLSAKVYRLLYEYAKDLDEGSIVEIGAAHGAGTVSLALGAKASESTRPVVAVEKGEGGTMDKYGSRDENLGILRANLGHHNVETEVTVVPEYLRAESGVPNEIAERTPISLLCLDADGRLDRSFELLYEHLAPGAIVVIDDYSPRRPRGKENSKFYKTFCLANALLNKGYLERFKVFHEMSYTTRSVLVAVKPPGAPEFNREALEPEISHLGLSSVS